MPIEPGTPLGPYEIVSLVGTGGMGEVYKAWDPKLDRFVAIKVLPEFCHQDSTFLSRFEREAKVLASLSHPNIVGIFDFGEFNDRAYAVMELLQGCTLRQAIESGPIPIRAALDIGAQVASGLAAAHTAGVIHRDLKPENIFLADRGLVKVLDFGLAKKIVRRKEGDPEGFEEVLPTSTNAGVIMGTIGYMAPEQLQPDGAVDGRSDLFTLGCVIYEMVTGTRAFTSETPMGTLHAILTQEPDLERVEIPAGLREFLRHCLEKRPELRFQNALDLAFALQALDSPAIPPAPPTRHPRRWRWILPALLGAGLTSVALALRTWLIHPPLPSFTALSPDGGQIYAARFTGSGGRAVFSLRQEDGLPQAVETTAGGGTSMLPGLQGTIPLAHFPQGGWLVLRATRRWSGGRELVEGDLLRSNSQGGHLEVLADGVSSADVSPDGETITAIRRVDGRDRLEAPLGSVKAESDGWMEAPRFSPSGQWIAYLDHPAAEGGSAVILLDLRDGKRRILSQGWRDLHGLSWAPSGEVWFTAAKVDGPRALYAVSVRGKVRPIAAAPESLTIEDISRDGQVLITQERWEDAVIARPPTGDPGLLNGDLGLLGLSYDGQWAAVQSPPSATGKVHLRRLGGATEEIGFAVLAAPSPDGAGVALALPGGGGWDLRIWSRQGARKIHLPSFNTLRQIAWMPDGGALLFSGTEGAGGFRIWRMDADGSGLQPVCPEGISADTPFLVSPDGRWLLAQAGPLFARFDLKDPQAIPQTVAGISPGERIMGWGRDNGHVLVIGPRLPTMTATVDLSDGSRQAAFPIAPYGHAGALIGAALSTQAGEAFAIECHETRSRLFLASNLR